MSRVFIPLSIFNASTFSDELKNATGRKSKVYAVGIREHSAIFSAGHAADGAFWYDNYHRNMDVIHILYEFSSIMGK